MDKTCCRLLQLLQWRVTFCSSHLHPFICFIYPSPFHHATNPYESSIANHGFSARDSFFSRTHHRTDCENHCVRRTDPRHAPNASHLILHDVFKQRNRPNRERHGMRRSRPKGVMKDDERLVTYWLLSVSCPQLSTITRKSGPGPSLLHLYPCLCGCVSWQSELGLELTQNDSKLSSHGIAMSTNQFRMAIAYVKLSMAE